MHLILKELAGRLMDLIESGKLATEAIKFFVLDEADRLLDTGNLDTILKMFGRFPKGSAGTARLQASTCITMSTFSLKWMGKSRPSWQLVAAGIKRSDLCVTGCRCSCSLLRCTQRRSARRRPRSARTPSWLTSR